MKRRHFCGFCAALCGGLPAVGTRANAPRPAGSPEEAANARAWRQLRPLRGHFDGAAWNDDTDRWQGRKHRVMLALAASLLNRQASAQDVLHTLGQADRRLRAGEPGHAAVLEQLSATAGPANPREARDPVANPGASELWLYRWRGTHDQLVLTLVQGQLQGTAWLHAFE